MRLSGEKFIAIGLLWLRVLMGLGIASHGYSKIFVFGVEKFSQSVLQMGFPVPIFFAWLAALSEFLGGILIVLGLGTKIAAFLVFVTMSVAAFIAHGGDPFSKRELALSYWTISSTLILTGAGPLSIDGLISFFRSMRKKTK